MKPASNLRILFLTFLGASLIFACSTLSGTPPTATPAPTSPPAPTDTPLPAPTDTPAAVPTEVPTDIPTEMPTAAPNATTLEISQLNSFVDSYDTLQVIGLIANGTDRVVDSVEIEIEVFDANNTVLYTEIAYPELYYLAPGETSPFGLAVYETLEGVDHVDATIVGSSIGEIDRASLDVKSITMLIDDSGDPHLVGELVNNNNSPVQISAFAGAVFDDNGNIIAEDMVSAVTRYLEPEESTPFRISMLGLQDNSDVFSSYEIYLDAIFTDPLNVIDLTFSDAYNFQDYYEDLHLVGEVTNNGANTLNLRLVAGIYDDAGNVLDAASIDLPNYALAEDETSPYDFDFWGPMNYIADLYDRADQYTIQVDPYWTWETDVVLIDLETINDDNTFDEYGGQFTGQIRNNSDGPIEQAFIIIYLRDTQTGEVVSMGYDFTYETLDAGSSIDYTVYLETWADIDLDAVEYYTIVKGQPPAN